MCAIGRAGNHLMVSLRALFRTFLSLGLTSYGGLAMIEPMRQRVVERHRWLNQRDFLDGVALCQLLPGATIVQLGAYVGFRLRGTVGSLAAAGGFILPAFLLMLGLSRLYLAHADLAWVQTVSRGLGPVVIALLLKTMWSLSGPIRQDWRDPALAALVLAGLWLGANYLAIFLGAGLLRALLPGTSRAPAGGWEAGEPPAQTRGDLTALLLTCLVLGAVFAGLFLYDRVLGRLMALCLKIGLISFGGGYVMIPILQWELVEHHAWLTLRQFLDGLLLSYATPGPLLILAAFVGYAVKGAPGALGATVAIFAAPTLLVAALTPLYRRGRQYAWMQRFIQGILAALLGMLALVTVQLGRAALTDGPSVALMLGAAAALIALNLNLLWVALAAAGLSFWLW